MSVEGNKHPTVVDISHPGRALAVEIDVSEAAELLMSLCTLSGEEDLDSYELGRTRLEELRAQAPAELLRAADELLVGSEKLPAHLLGLVYETARPRSVGAFLDRLAATDPLEIQLHLLGYYMLGHHVTGPEAIRSAAAGDSGAQRQLLEAVAEWSGKHEAVERLLSLGAEEVKRRVLELLPSWNEHVFRPLAAEASALAERDAEAKRRLARTIPPEQLVERTTDGLQYAPRPDVHKLVFFPTYCQRPWVILGEYKHVKVYCYPISVDHEQADERSALEIARTYKALADESRLRLLRRLQTGPVTLTEAADELGLAKSTTHHHLSILRHAGFVMIRDDQEKLYSLRPDLLPDVGALLGSYLRS
ncbi:MAG TPA: helix-turn-helix domain-containing protein [Gaiellaceae bacterium]|nr:helix-turn-helix domain-containing protein [Gaiellaceae bacterium]